MGSERKLNRWPTTGWKSFFINNWAAQGEPDAMDGHGKEPNMIASDPPDHDRMRRRTMRHFGPLHSPDVILRMEAECVRIVNAWLDKARIDVVDACPLPVEVICKILGIPLEDCDAQDGREGGPGARPCDDRGPRWRLAPRQRSLISSRVLRHLALLGLDHRVGGSGQPRPGGKD